jgi:hypothetical protein
MRLGNIGPAFVFGFRVPPDGPRLAFNDYADRGFSVGESSLWLRGLRPGATPRKISRLMGRPIWSSDGKHLLVVTVMTGLCTVPNVEDRRMRIVPHPPATLLGHPEWP